MLQRPLILIAHSLGGIVVKQMLASSSHSTEDRLKDVVSSTVAVLFLGTPHRGSPHLATLGERARSMVSALRMRTNPAILDALRLKTRDLELVQESFSEVWSRYDFRVKTFQEGLGLSGLNLGPLGRKVVPDYSSLLGDVRERAETIQANHMDMCRFAGPDDPNYGRICGEITTIYESIAGLNTTTTNRGDSHSFINNTLTTASREREAEEMDEHERTCLQSLSFPNMNQRAQNLESPAEGTCSWFFERKYFVDWLAHKDQAQACGLLWLRGKPGSGKSTLLKRAFFKTTTETSESRRHVAAFFFNAKGDDLEHSQIGMLRSILHQICSQNPHLRRALLDFAKGRRALCGEDAAAWDEAGLKDFLKYAMVGQKGRVHIFIDAIDECDSGSVRDVVDFWREFTKSAHNSGCQFSVCLSSRHSPAITVNNCPEIIMEDHNYPDIADFVGRRLDLGMSGTLEDRQAIQQKILEKSGGMFLWVSLVVKDILRKRDEGRGLKSLLKDLNSVPRELEDLFGQLLTTGESSEMAIRVFQWALLPAKPLRLHEWHHVLAFIGDSPPSSLHQWRQSSIYTETDEQLEKRITHLSRGLLGFNTRAGHTVEPVDESMSDRAGAGSLDLNTGETRVVQVIHESVRQYFMAGAGFSVLNPDLGKQALARAHHQIMGVCLDYILIAELDALVEARERAQQCIADRQAQVKNGPYHSVPDLSHLREGMALDPGPLDIFREGMALDLDPLDIFRTMDLPRTLSRPGRPESVASFGSASSHDGRQTPVELGHHYREPWQENNLQGSLRRKRSLPNDSPSPAPHTRRRMDGGPPTPIASYDIASWRSISFHSADEARFDEAHFDEAAQHDSPEASITGRSQVLEDYPALLSYSTSELFTHARKADAEGLDPTLVGRRLRDGAWNRWRALREDIGGLTGLLYYAAGLGLSSWLQAKNIWEESEAVSAIASAIADQNFEVLGKLLKAFPSATYVGNAGNMVLALARVPDAALLQAYLSRYPSQERGTWSPIATKKDTLDSRDQEGRTALHLAVIQQNKAAILVLLNHGADISAVEPKLWAPLHVACMNTRSANAHSSDKGAGGDVSAPCRDIIELLLSYHAYINAVDAKGRTPLMVACSNSALPARRDAGETLSGTGARDPGAVDVLLRHGADATMRNSGGLLPLHEACWTGSGGLESKVSMVRKLLDYGSPVNATETKSKTPLHFACYCSDHQVVEELLHRGANPSQRDLEGRSPLHIAAAWSTEQVVETLLSCPDPLIDAADIFGSTPLHLACTTVSSNGDQNKSTALSIIRRLLAHGAKAHTLRDKAGDLPVDVARKNGFEEALELLQANKS